jgi:hypothetical protein
VKIIMSLPDPDRMPTEQRNDEWTECIFMGPQVMRHILSLQGFPKPVPKPPHIRHKIAPSSFNPCDDLNTAGLGMFATVDLEFGDLILAERPLLLFDGGYLKLVEYTPDLSVQDWWQAFKDESKKLFNTAVGRMSEERKDALFNLAASDWHHKVLDEIPHTMRLLGTNGFRVFIDKKEHIAVYDKLSRINHR